MWFFKVWAALRAALVWFFKGPRRYNNLYIEYIYFCEALQDRHSQEEQLQEQELGADRADPPALFHWFAQAAAAWRREPLSGAAVDTRDSRGT